LGDANFHIITLVDIRKEGIIPILHQLMEEVYSLVFEYSGSVSGEHNNGLLRSEYVSKMFSQDMIGLFEKTKNIFDPLHVLSPGKKVFPNKEFLWSRVDNWVRAEKAIKLAKIVVVPKEVMPVEIPKEA
jgi:hypothetical protein